MISDAGTTIASAANGPRSASPRASAGRSFRNDVISASFGENFKGERKDRKRNDTHDRRLLRRFGASSLSALCNGGALRRYSANFWLVCW